MKNNWKESFSEKFGGITAHEAGQNWLPMYEDIQRFIQQTIDETLERVAVSVDEKGGELIGVLNNAAHYQTVAYFRAGEIIRSYISKKKDV